VTGGTVADVVLRRTIELAELPAPTGFEANRAALVRSWWDADGWRDVRVDETGNVWAHARRGNGAAVILCAHIDTVFGPGMSHRTRSDGTRLCGPGVGDDAVGVASLSAAAGLLGGAGMPVWLLASVGEEGLGNLCGVSAALDAPPEPVGAFIAVEGNYLGRVSAVGVGSVRRRITVTGLGGHAWETPDAPSAVHAVAGLVSEIASMSPIDGTSVNAGRIGGGEGINMRAREAWFELDLRADDPRTLAALARDVDAIVARIDEPLRVERTVLGDRPAGRLDPAHPLVRAAGDALREAGIEVRPVATSTDANAAHARGIPAIAIGVTTGAGEHTPQEWIDTAPIGDGVRALARTVTRFEELSA
jgi:acetylornithine deacetylase/succinyl-diaminopimelate desuccinylase-like protein